MHTFADKSEMVKRLHLLLLVVLMGTVVALAGCGGGGGRSPADSGFGTTSFVIEWPARSSKVPVAESVRIVIRSQSASVANQVFDRPSDGSSSSTFRIDPVPTGDFTVTATAYSLARGGGSEAGMAYSPITVRSRQTSSITFSASATIDHIEIAADKTAIPVNGTAHLVAMPRSSSGAVVVVPAGNLNWESLDIPVASVDSAGIVTGVAKGNADIKVTESGSGMNATIQITVSGASWTVMVYMGADNNLETFALQDMNEMETVGSTSSVSVVAQVDRSSGYDTTDGNWTGARRYYVTKDSDTSIVHSEMIADLGPTDMAAPNTLTSFMHWATENYPAEHYLLVLWDHGRGWRSQTYLQQSAPRQVKAIFTDESSGGEMSLLGLTQALEQSPRMDVILFDACLMAMLEVAYSIQNCADVMVASEENVPVYGHAYDTLLSRITTNPDISSSDLGTAAVDEYIDSYSGSYTGTFAMSAINLLLLDDLVSATDNLAGEIMANMTEVRTGVESAQFNTQHYDYDHGDYRYYRDLYDFARRVNDNVDNPAVKTAARNVMSKLDDAVIYERHLGSQMSNSHGISIYLPDPGTMLSMYDALDFSSATRWNELISTY